LPERHYLSSIKRFLQISFVVISLSLSAQEKPPRVKEKYDRKEEMIYDNKRYQIHNNYLTVGGGVLSSSIRAQSQNNLGLDFQFHIRRQHFQAGGMISGESFGSNNHSQAHIGYGYRQEKRFTNLAAFAGLSYGSGVEGQYPNPAVFYTSYGGYACIQFIYKFAFDIGLGLEGFADFSYKQNIYGFKVIAFFSGAYRGKKANYNPHVKSERPK